VYIYIHKFPAFCCQLPDKSISSLVKYFYSWKKTRTRTSLMDRHAKKRKLDGDSEGGSDAGSGASDQDVEMKEVRLHSL
jgi:REST corepressor 1